MSGETEASPSAWTIDSTRTYLQTQIEDLKERLQERTESDRRAIDAALVAHQEALHAATNSQDKALQVALASLEKRLDAMTAMGSMPRTESLALHGATAEKIDALTARHNDLELRVTSRLEAASGGQQATYRMIGWSIGGVGLLMTVVVFVANYIFK